MTDNRPFVPHAATTLALMAAPLLVAQPALARQDPIEPITSLASLDADWAAYDLEQAAATREDAPLFPASIAAPALDQGDQWSSTTEQYSIAVSRDEPVRDYASFGEDVKAIKWEVAGLFGYYTAINASKIFREDAVAPQFIKEGWFGADTKNVGVDKLAHFYSTYLMSEIVYGRLKHKVGDAPGIEVTAAVIGSGALLWSEFFDSIEGDGGWSWEDVAMNTAGAGFSVLRNSVPGLEEKIDYRLMIEPNSNIYTISGKEHFEQQRYFFALKPAGFKQLEETPLRFLEFHVGYHAKDFTDEDRLAGIQPKRHIFFGVGPNLSEIFFKRKKGKVARAADEVLDYFQLPYTAAHVHLTE